MFEDVMTQLAENDMDLLARLLLILLTLLLTLIAQRLARSLVVRLLEFLFGALVRIGKLETQFEAGLSQKLARPVTLIVLMLGGRVVLALLEPSPSLTVFANQLISSVVIFSIFWALYQITNIVSQFYVTRASRATSSLDETIVRFLRQVAIVLILIIALTLVLGQWGQDVGGLIAGLGVASLAVALAAQDALANIISYFAILMDTPFKVGDFIIIEGVVKGRVMEIKFRTTRIRTIDHSVMAIPNQTIANANVVNWARIHRRRIDILLGVTYSTTYAQIERLLADIRAMLLENEAVFNDRLVVDFVEFGESSLNLRVTFLARATTWEDLEQVKTQINLSLMKLLEANAVSIAFPTRTLHIEGRSYTPD